MLITDLAQALEIARRRRYHAGGARNRLDDNGRDIAAIVQRAQAFEIIGQVCTPLGLAATERVVFEIQGVPQVIDAGNQRGAEDLAIRDDAANRHAAEIDAVIAFLAADQARPVAFAASAVITDRDLESRVYRLRSRVREKAVVQSLGSERRDACCQLKGLVVRDLETHAEIEFRDLLLHRGHDLRVTMTDTARPEAGERVVKARAVIGRVPVTRSAGDHAWFLIEIAVRRKRHPVWVLEGGTHSGFSHHSQSPGASPECTPAQHC